MISDEQARLETIRSATTEEYTSALSRQGVVVVPGAGRSFWRGHEMRSLEREPMPCLDEPTADEVSSILWRTRSPVITYNRRPDDAHPQNAWLYICRNQDYSLEGLESTARRDARRALRAFRFDFVDMETFLRKGVVPFCDTRTRVGLSDGTPEKFRRRFEAETHNPAHRVVGAWKDDALVAFISLMVVDDWVSIAPYAATEHLKSCPNNGLIHFTLDYLLTQHKYHIVNYGLSSIQEVSKADGLHRFKNRVGFEACPIHRAFVFHPLLRPLANPVTLWAMRACVRVWPDSRVLRKTAGLLATYLGKNPALVKFQQTEGEEPTR